VSTVYIMSISKLGLINPFEKSLRKIEISPTTDPKVFSWKCPLCAQVNEEPKSGFSDNHLYTCFDCKYSHMIQNIPDDIRHWLQSKDLPQNVNVRPRIVRSS